MDALVQQSIRESNSKIKDYVPWKLDEPYPQACFIYSEDDWTSYGGSTLVQPGQGEISKLALYSWNIDFMLPFPQSRMGMAISHLKSLVEDDPRRNTTATIIFFQECLESDLSFIASHPWIRQNFIITDLDTQNWQSGHYGTISIVDRRLPISSCFRVHFSQTRMERDGLFVDVGIRDKTIRLCNTHLESLAFEPPFRPPQMKIAAEYMRRSSVDAALLAGDLNAIQDFDRHLHLDNGLKDAYLELGGSEDEPSGHTWGQQAATVQRDRFGTSRMDKVFFCGSVGVKSFEKIGADVMLEDQAEAEQLVELGFDRPWITDHLGVKAVFELSDANR